MPFSHHSHSGQFCPGHARNSLEEMIRTAISNKFQLFAVTEHMPRDQSDLYPEEIEAGGTPDTLLEYHNAFYEEAVRLREKYQGQIEILIGFEGDWIRTSSKDAIERLLQAHEFDLFIGSVHHVHTIPIDYDSPMYLQAREVSGGTDERLFEDYFDSQYDLLQALRPPVVGHFDLIRLKSDDMEQSFQQWPQIWQKIRRNLAYVASYGGLLELNFASIRKGMREPYPKGEICKAFLEEGGRFVLSDDSHGIEQVGLNYHLLLNFLEEAGIGRLCYLTRSDQRLSRPIFPRFPKIHVASYTFDALRQHKALRDLDDRPTVGS